MKEKFCIVVDLPDGLNVFAGFHCEINPLTGSKTYFNIWELDISKVKLFRSKAQADTALKLVDGKQIIYARVETYSKIKKQDHVRKN